MQLALDVPRPSALPSPRPAPQPTTCACERCERTRVREHLLGAIEQMLASPGTTTEARVARAALIAELVRYAVRGVFPRNETVLERKVPIFVDRIGTRCAVAHLLDHTGEHALVDDVARVANGAFVGELARDARLRSWLDDWHLTEAEAARIQPCYNCPAFEPVQSCACSLPGLDEIFVGRFERDAEGGDLVLVVEAAYGATTVASGDVLTAWRERDGTHLSNSEGRRVLATTDGTGPALLLENVNDDDLVGVSCYACMPITHPPSGAPLGAFIAVAEGSPCVDVFGELEGWGRQTGSECNYMSSSYVATSVGAGGSGDGGGDYGPNLGLDPAPSTAIDDGGCGIAGAGLLDPVSQGLLWALVSGVAAARRRGSSRPS